MTGILVGLLVGLLAWKPRTLTTNPTSKPEKTPNLSDLSGQKEGMETRQAKIISAKSNRIGFRMTSPFLILEPTIREIPHERMTMNTTTQKNNGPGYKWEILRNEDDLAEWGEAYLFSPHRADNPATAFAFVRLAGDYFRLGFTVRPLRQALKVIGPKTGTVYYIDETGNFYSWEKRRRAKRAKKSAPEGLPACAGLTAAFQDRVGALRIAQADSSPVRAGTGRNWPFLGLLAEFTGECVKGGKRQLLCCCARGIKTRWKASNLPCRSPNGGPACALRMTFCAEKPQSAKIFLYTFFL